MYRIWVDILRYFFTQNFHFFTFVFSLQCFDFFYLLKDCWVAFYELVDFGLTVHSPLTPIAFLLRGLHRALCPISLGERRTSILERVISPVTVDLIALEVISAARNQRWLYMPISAIPSTAGSRSHPHAFFRESRTGFAPGLDLKCRNIY